MLIAKYLGFFFFSMFKFLFAPFGGPAAGLTFIETYISCCSGALLSSSICFFLASYLLRKSLERKKAAEEKAILKGIPFVPKKKFTKFNKKIIKLKQTMGIYGITFIAPLFFSIPVGTIIVAKFFGKLKITYPLLLTTILINGFATTGLAYLIASFV
jgi:hypothetical protein